MLWNAKSTRGSSSSENPLGQPVLVLQMTNSQKFVQKCST